MGATVATVPLQVPLAGIHPGGRTGTFVVSSVYGRQATRLSHSRYTIRASLLASRISPEREYCPKMATCLVYWGLIVLRLFLFFAARLSYSLARKNIAFLFNRLYYASRREFLSSSWKSRYER